MERDKELVELEDSSRHCSEPSTGRRKDPAELGSSHFKLMSCGIPRWSSCNCFFLGVGQGGLATLLNWSLPGIFLLMPTQPNPTHPTGNNNNNSKKRKKEHTQVELNAAPYFSISWPASGPKSIAPAGLPAGRDYQNYDYQLC